MPKKSSPLPITSAQRQTLETWIRAHNTPQSIAIRAKIILLAADGLSNVKIAQEANVTRPTVILWRERFMEGGPEAITTILPGRGHPVTYTAEKVQRIWSAHGLQPHRNPSNFQPIATLLKSSPMWLDCI